MKIYIEYRKYTKATQLFDLESDPWEVNDLYGRKEYANVVVDLRRELVKFRDKWSDNLHSVGRKFWENY
ncbi:DUF4976 domain-containing protein [bacterium]|nr:DUF4976 domain-containing protein [bacterium]